MHFLRKIAFMAFLTPFAFIQADVEEVIVTANKKVETVQEIPMNISVITDVDIEERGITTPEDFFLFFAGVTTPGGSRYYSFRGLNTSSAQRSSGTTSTYIDEIPGRTMNIWDIDRIEVLRGPQGTLYGSNAIGGTIRYITKKPDLSGFDKRIDLVQQEVEMLQSEMSMILEEVGLVADVAKELKNDLKGDVRRIETIVEDVETRVKEDSRSNEKDLKLTVDGIESDMQKLENELNEAMTELQESIDKQIKMTLANPLSQMK